MYIELPILFYKEKANTLIDLGIATDSKDTYIEMVYFKSVDTFYSCEGGTMVNDEYICNMNIEQFRNYINQMN